MSAQGAGVGAVLLALIGNTLLTIIKFVAFLFSGSGAMLSESIHSLADTFNQGLLYLGIRRSERVADAMFPYGYGVERYFFALLSAVGIFVLGCGVTIYHGIHTLISPPELRFTWITWVVLLIALIVDGFVFMKVVAAIRSVMSDRGLRHFLRYSTDPTVTAVLFEDGVAVLGVLVAAAGIGLSHLTGSHVPDAIGSIVIGLLLGAVAVWMGLKNRQLILGQAIPPERREEMRRFLESQETIKRVRTVRSRVIGAEAFKYAADVEFDGRPLGRNFKDWVTHNLPDREKPEEVAEFSAEFGGKVLDALGDEVDRVEAEFFTHFPRLRHLDLEAD